jgi:DNA-binding protein H-NS
VEYENLSVEEIEQQLHAIDQNRADLEKALEKRQQEARDELAQQIKDMIVEHGYEVSDIVPLLGVRKRRSPSRKGGRQYTRYADPDNPNNVYSRGVIPGWMKQKMRDEGYNPANKADREAFKANCLHALDD